MFGFALPFETTSHVPETALVVAIATTERILSAKIANDFFIGWNFQPEGAPLPRNRAVLKKLATVPPSNYESDSVANLERRGASGVEWTRT